jgi:ABC-2 type transport system permease protein
MYWSVRRELWENRSLYVAPLAVAAVMPFGFLIAAIGMPQRRRAVLLLDPVQQRAMIGKPYDIAAVILIVIAFIVAFFYCLDALHGERRDRSILFWKSLPVSDRTTVLAKATIPLAILPAIVFAIVIATQFIMLLLSTAVLLRSGLAGTTWTRFNLIQQSVILFYGLIALALWHAPIYGWLLLVSSWARRATFLWAVMPFFAIAAFERIALNSSRFGLLLRWRVMGFAAEAFAPNKYGSIDSLTQLTPGRFLSTPGLWIGLILTVLFLAAAMRIRRYRDPI